MYVDCLLLERVCLLFDDEFVVDFFGLAQAVRTFRGQERSAEPEIDLGDIEGRRCRHLCNLIGDELFECLQCSIHVPLLFREAFFEWLRELELFEAFITRLGQHQRGFGCKVSTAVRTLCAGVPVRRDDGV